MKVVILAGGLGTRLSEETQLKPKPMVEIGGKPILWHIMKMYSAHGIKDFIICCGYKGHIIKEFFANYFMYSSDITIDLETDNLQIHKRRAEPWKITLVDTGPSTMTGGRLLRVKEYLREQETFCFTYGDGVSDVDISETIHFHKKHGKDATLVSVLPPGRFGSLELNGNVVTAFKEKPQGDGARINGGFFVLNKRVLNLIENDDTVWEEGPLRRLAGTENLMAFKHDGFWQSMDTLREKEILQSFWESGHAPWKKWNN